MNSNVLHKKMLGLGLRGENVESLQFLRFALYAVMFY